MPRIPRPQPPPPGMVRHTINGVTFTMSKECERYCRAHPPQFETYEAYLQAHQRRAGMAHINGRPNPRHEFEAWLALQWALYNKAPAGTFDDIDGTTFEGFDNE